MNEAQKKISEKLQEQTQAQKLRTVELYRIIYNKLCKKCRDKIITLVLKKKDLAYYELLCDECKVMVKSYEKKLNEVL